MISMPRLAGFHHGYGHGYGHGSTWLTHGLTHMILSSAIHGLIYSALFRVLRHLSLGEVVLLAVIVIGLIHAANRNRSYRQW